MSNKKKLSESSLYKASYYLYMALLFIYLLIFLYFSISIDFLLVKDILFVVSPVIMIFTGYKTVKIDKRSNALVIWNSLFSMAYIYVLILQPIIRDLTGNTASYDWNFPDWVNTIISILAIIFGFIAFVNLYSSFRGYTHTCSNCGSIGSIEREEILLKSSLDYAGMLGYTSTSNYSSSDVDVTVYTTTDVQDIKKYDIYKVYDKCELCGDSKVYEEKRLSKKQ